MDEITLAAQAFASIQFPTPVPQLGPVADKIAVTTWTYLWVNDPGTLTATAAVPGLSVTATAALTSTTWSVGELVKLDKRGIVAPFDCVGAGKAPPLGAEVRITERPSTSCAYAYKWRSLPERTDDTGTWPMTVSTTWTITWTASNGATGTATRTQTSAPLQVSVGEWRAILIDPNQPIEPGG